MDLDDNIIALAMSLPYGSRIQDPSLLGEILDEVDHQNLSLEDVDPALDNISDDLDLTDEEAIWLRVRLREEISRECD
jgi:hypothetical protein